ncbi:olfactory receptor 2G3-like [Gastrophryne carolinensis]
MYNKTDLFFLGFLDLPRSSQVCLFVFFIVIYILSLTGNALIILTVTLDPKLHTPMYYFLRILSFIELCSVNITIPRSLQTFLLLERTISPVSCATQMFLFSVIAVTECLLLAVMAFDRYVAICYPLRYKSVMTPFMCLRLATGSWVLGFTVSLAHPGYIFNLPFCSSHRIDHFFCDIAPVLSLACANTVGIELYLLVVSVLGTVFPVVMIFGSYIRILASIFLIHSSEARQKALSTCGAHLVSVIIFYGTAMYVHLRIGVPITSYEERMNALFYCLVIPTINPLIYTLKNKEMKRALGKIYVRVTGFNVLFL